VSFAACQRHVFSVSCVGYIIRSKVGQPQVEGFVAALFVQVGPERRVGRGKGEERRVVSEQKTGKTERQTSRQGQ